MTTPKITELIRNVNQVGKPALDRQRVSPIAAGQTPSR
jgi:hypothetical protein